MNHYVPFPQSEYGGLWNIIAENDDECFDLITKEDSGNFYEQYYGDLRDEDGRKLDEIGRAHV